MAIARVHAASRRSWPNWRARRCRPRQQREPCSGCGRLSICQRTSAAHPTPMRSPQAMSLAGQDISQGTRGVGWTIASLSQARVPRPTELAPRDGALWVGRRTALRSRLVGLFRARRFQKPIDLGGGPNADAHPVRQAAGCHGTNDQAMLLQLSRECSATCDICEDEIGMRHVIVPRAEVLENAAKHGFLAALILP